MQCSQCKRNWHVGGVKCPYCGGRAIEEAQPSVLYGYHLGSEKDNPPIKMGRRGFLTAAAGAGVAVAGTAAGIGYVVSKDSGSGSASSGENAANSGMNMQTEPVPTSEPAKPVDVDEISRHPTEMPASADYTLYDNGQYQNFVQRSGPLTQEVHIYVKELVAQIVDGTTMAFWTFDQKVPGPMVRCRAGDHINFFLHNDSTSTMPHNVDFHSVNGPGGGALKLDTAPGAVSNLKVKMIAPGIFIYHCAFPDIPTHVSHGMYGLIVVEPEAGLPAVDHEYYLMQSEFYTVQGGSKTAVQLRKAGHLEFSLEFGALEQPTFVVFNGRPDSITGDRTIGLYQNGTINAGETVRLFVGNIGPNLISSFHVIGEIFDTVYVEGSFALQNHNVQTTLVPSGGAAGVEFKVDVPGEYVIVDHSLFRTHKGALGVIQAAGADNPDLFDSIKYSSEVRG